MKFKNLIRLLINHKLTIWILFLVFALWYTQSKQHLPINEFKSLLIDLLTWKLFYGCGMGLFVLTYNSENKIKIYRYLEKLIWAFIILNFILGVSAGDYFFWMPMTSTLIGYYLAVPLIKGMFRLKIRNFAYFFEFRTTKEEKSFIYRNIEKFNPIVFEEIIETPVGAFISSRPFDLVTWLSKSNLKKELSKLDDEFFYRISLSLEAIHEFLEDSKLLTKEDKRIYGEDVEVNSEIVKRRHKLEEFRSAFKERWKLDPFMEK